MSEKLSQFNPLPERRREIKERDKAERQDERNQTLQNIRELRHHRGELNDRAQKIQSRLEQNRQHVEHTSQETLELRERYAAIALQIKQRETSLLKRIVDKVHSSTIDELQESDADIQQGLQAHTEDQTSTEAEIAQLEQEYARIQADKELLAKQQWQQLDAHYFNAAGEWLKQKEHLDLLDLEIFKQEHGTVTEIASEKDVYFTHGIHRGKVSSARIGDRRATWANRAACLMVKQPQISASAMGPRSERDPAWSKIGLILQDGIIEMARPRDAGTYTVPDGKRRPFNETFISKNIQEYQKDIDWSLEDYMDKRDYSRQKPYSAYNEFIIDKPKAAGLYIALDSRATHTNDGQWQTDHPIHVNGTFARSIIGQDRFKHQVPVPDLKYGEVFTTAQKLGLPVFGFFKSNATAFLLDMSPDGTIVIERPVSPQEVTRWKNDYQSRPEIKELADIPITTDIAA